MTLPETTAGYAPAPGGFAMKKRLRSLLESPDFEERLQSAHIAPIKLVNPLLSFLCQTNELIRWRAARGVGITVSALARTNLEAAREIMRRLIWSLNDESGGIGWGAPEAMGEIMAENENLALEYHRILVSYIDENGNPLDNELLECAVMWALCRLAQKRPQLLRDWIAPILARLKSPAPLKRGLALLTLLCLAQTPENLPETRRLAPLLLPLRDDPSEMRILQNGTFVHCTIAAMTRRLLSLIDLASGTG